jgi:hypothetical protein
MENEIYRTMQTTYSALADGSLMDVMVDFASGSMCACHTCLVLPPSPCLVCCCCRCCPCCPSHSVLTTHLLCSSPAGGNRPYGIKCSNASINSSGEGGGGSSGDGVTSTKPNNATQLNASGYARCEAVDAELRVLGEYGFGSKVVNDGCV